MILISANTIFSETGQEILRKASNEIMNPKVVVVCIGITFFQATEAYNGTKGRKL